MQRILVVEDSLTQARQLAFILEDAGYSVEIAPHAERALECLNRERFDAVLSDVMLPGDSGFDLCRRIKADPQLSRLPVLVRTAQVDPVNVLRGLQAGADDFLSKGRDPEEIVRCLQRALARTPYVSTVERAHVEFLGQTFEISAGRDHLLNVLLAAFEDFVHLNQRYQEEISQRCRVEAELQKARQAAKAAPAPSQQKGGHSTGSEEVIDREAALANVRGSKELLRDLVKLFLAEHPAYLRDLDQGIRRGDASQVNIIAHTLNGSLRVFGAKTARQAAQVLEEMGKSRNLTGADIAFSALQEAIRRLQPELIRLTETEGAVPEQSIVHPKK